MGKLPVSISLIAILALLAGAGAGWGDHSKLSADRECEGDRGAISVDGGAYARCDNAVRRSIL